MLPPITLAVPLGTKAIYLTALSLCPTTSTVSVFWRDQTATFGADFVGPSPTYVLPDKVFGAPIVTVDGTIPAEISVSMNFNDTMVQQHSISGPETKRVGPEGCSTQVQIMGYAFGDVNKERPTTITIMFEGTLH